jgi:hypothetical protein
VLVARDWLGLSPMGNFFYFIEEDSNGNEKDGYNRR